MQNKRRFILFTGFDPAESMTFNKEKQAELIDAMMDDIKEPDINALLHYASAYCNSGTILKALHMGADIMAENSLHCLPLEVAIANKNS
jgi:hypothetical protein